MSKLIAVQGCTIDYDLPDDALGSVELVTEVAPATSKTSAKGNRAYKKEITIAVVSGTVTLSSTPEGATSPSGTVPPGSIKIEGSSEKATAEGDVFVVENDEGEETFTCIFPGPNGSTVPADVKIRAKVSDAGQDVSKVT
jgi:hypothetical protein